MLSDLVSSAPSMSPEVTAVITTHGRPDVVCDAIASVQGEVHQNIEVIVVDDGGTFVAPPIDADVDLRVVRGSELGVARARNLGLEHARGEFVIYLDDDDIALPNRISALLSAARQHGASLCFGMTRRVVDGSAVVLEDVPTQQMSSGPIGFCDLLTCTPHVNAVLVRTETLRAVGGFDAGIEHFDDWAVWLRIADREDVKWRVEETVAEWRVHTHGLSGKVHQAGLMKRRILAFFEKIRASLSDESAQAVAAARRIVDLNDIQSYDDYVSAMATAREGLHAEGTCFGRPLAWHARADR